MSRKLSRRALFSTVSAAAAMACASVAGLTGNARADVLQAGLSGIANNGTYNTIYTVQGGGTTIDFQAPTALETDTAAQNEGVTIGVVNEGNPIDSLSNPLNAATTSSNFYSGYTAYAIVATTDNSGGYNFTDPAGGPSNGANTGSPIVTNVPDTLDNNWNIGYVGFGGAGGSASYGVYATAGSNFLQQVLTETTSAHRSTGVTTTATTTTYYPQDASGDATGDGSYAGLSGDSHFMNIAGGNVTTNVGGLSENNNASNPTSATTVPNVVNAVAISGYNGDPYSFATTSGAGATKTTTTTSAAYSVGTDSTIFDTYSIAAADQSDEVVIGYVVVPNGEGFKFDGALATLNPTASSQYNTIPVAFTFAPQSVASGPAKPAFPFSIDDYSTNGASTTDPTSSQFADPETDEAGDTYYVDAANATPETAGSETFQSSVAADDKNVSNDSANLNGHNGYDNTAFEDLQHSNEGAQDAVYTNYTGATNGTTLDVLLKLTTSTGGDITGSALANIVAYINANTDAGDTGGDANLTASVLAGASTQTYIIADQDLNSSDSLGLVGSNVNDGEWDILLQDTSEAGDPLASFDFSALTGDSAYGLSAGQKLEVAQIAIVPEPSSLGLMAFASAGLLLRGRKKKA